MTLPPKISTRGGGTTGVSAVVWNQLIDYLKSTRIVPNINVSPRITSQGTILKTTETARRISLLNPWEIHNLNGDGEPDSNGIFANYKAKVYPATVNGILPNNLFSSGKLAEFSFPSSLTKWKCECTTDGRQITSCKIVVDETDPPQQTLVASLLPEKASFVFAVTNGGNVWQIRNQNVTANTDLSLITDKTSPPQPGIPGVDRWYEIKF